MDSFKIVLKIFVIFKVLCDCGNYGAPMPYNSDLSDITRYAGQYDIRSNDYFTIRYKKDGGTSDYSYDPASPNSPDKWSEIAPECAGKSQSPINIKTNAMKKSTLPAKMSATKWRETPSSIEIENNGHTVKFQFKYEDGESPVVKLNNRYYIFAQIHFHFGKNKKTSGTEHLINNRGFAMEGHAVLFNRDYETFENALQYPDGLAVLGKFYEPVGKLSTKLKFDFLANVREPGTKYIISNEAALFSLQDLFGNINFPHYSYKGSLTTPTCNEVVSWYVGEKLLGISQKALAQFYALNGIEGKMGANFRPIQPRNGRTVFYNKI